jgi:CRISPR-associated endonuclease Csn1
VSTGNNHHVAIYRDEKGNLRENVVSFYEAVARVNQGLPIINKMLNSYLGWTFLFTIKQNEYFIFPNADTGFNPNELDLLNPKNNKLISPNLFRVQKFGDLSNSGFWFRNHLESLLNTSKVLKGISFIDIYSSEILKTIVKVRINHIGQIVKIGEY